MASSKGVIVFVGTEEEFLAQVSPEPGAVTVDGQGMVALPGFVDAHTHLPFAGDRTREFGLRIQGLTYQQLAERGLGIQTTVKATRAASLDDLLALCLRRLDRMLLTGTTTVEAKSGYGLNLEDEVKQLEVLRDLAALHPVDIVPTFMGAHDVPPEYRDRREEYVRLLIDAGAVVALATDFNPGSSNLSAMPFVLQLGVFTLGMTVEEAINACTGNAAFAVGRHGSVGSLEVGKKMDLVLCDIPGYVSLAYELGRNPVRVVLKNGRVVVQDGRRVAAR